MKFTLSWLKDHLETDASLEEITERLTMLGLEVEEVVDRSADFAAFKSARVVEAKPHPDADRLQVCIVDTGEAEIQVVCGAPNARTGLKGVFAPEGAFIPGLGIELKKAKIRGVESTGMLLSEKELEISDEHDGIIELPDDTDVGVPFAQIAGLDDPMIELAITPNRGDCLGVRGIARDLAAAGLGTLKPLDESEVEATFETPVQWQRDFPDGEEDACPMVVGRSFKGVRNGPSPKWLQDRLVAIGLRPISALVDITNYISYDLGRPLHVFDIAKLKGNLTMRLARKGEKIEALDENTYELDEGMTVIADEAGVQGIAGVMGGLDSGCTETTTDVFLEVALFDPIRTATTGRKLGIESDARYRFERSVDPQSAVWGTEAASQLILELCGGEASDLSVAGELPGEAKPISLRVDRLESFGGIALKPKQTSEILKELGFIVSGKGKVLKAIAPSWRPDIEGEHCLIEEVLRIYGYDDIPTVPMDRETVLPKPILTARQRHAAFAKRALAGRGVMETVTWSFLPSQQAELFGGGASALNLDNPISSDLDAMRPSLLANLIAAAGRNADRGYPDLALFELGPAFRDDTPDGQDLMVGGLRHGSFIARHWRESARPVDAFDVKADALSVLEACNAPMASLQVGNEAPDWYHPGRSGTLQLGPNILARFGEIHPKVLRSLDVKGPAAGFEVFLEAVPLPKTKASKTRPALDASPLQPVTRDFAFVVDRDTPADKVARAAQGADKTLIEAVGIFDVFEGESLGDDKKSVALQVTLQPRDHTLTDEEIEAVADKVVANVNKQTGGTLRS
ncbi:MAG: phenylalanine--tRNA ligase subunit beta [Rhodospirillaceae bacterium]|nr:phenylalanine--tRNA ligase subunit beta [Rhodospirillaceae bacterium]